MKHLILGSEGQVGGHLRNIMARRGEDVFEFDIVRSPAEDLRTWGNPRLDEAMDACDFVHFLAFDVGGSTYMTKYQDTFDFVSNNVKIMDRVFDALKRTTKPFFFATSQMSNMSYSTYGILKAVGERYTRALNGVLVKFWNVYGYENDPAKSHVITDFIAMAKTQGRIRMRTDGHEERQFLYGDDCAECLLRLARMYRDIDRTKPLDITNFEWTSILRVAELISAQLGRCPIIPGQACDDLQRNKRNEPDPYVLRYWKPAIRLDEGIRRVVEQMRSAPVVSSQASVKPGC